MEPDPPYPPAPPADRVPAGAAEDPVMGALSARALVPQALTGGVAPFIVYQLALHAGAGDVAALALSSIPPALAVTGEWAWRRRLNVIGAIVLVGIGAGLISIVALHGNELLFKIRESVVTAMFGLVCLTSLVLPVRPAMFHIGRALASTSGRDRAVEFDLLWEREQARRVFRRITLWWGLGLLLEAGLRTVLAEELSTGRFLAAAPVANWAVLGTLVVFTVRSVRAARRRADMELGEAVAG